MEKMEGRATARPVRSESVSGLGVDFDSDSDSDSEAEAETEADWGTCPDLAVRELGSPLQAYDRGMEQPNRLSSVVHSCKHGE